MLTRQDERCDACAHWSNRFSAIAAATRRAEGSDPDLGICMLYGPSVVSTVNGPVSMYPEVRGDRTCRDWSPSFEPDDDDGEKVIQFAERRPAA